MEGLTIVLLAAIGFWVLLPFIHRSDGHFGASSAMAYMRSAEAARGVVGR
jgi:hypothetical protein